MQEEADITCPFCWQAMTVLIDLSVPEQTYIEDCQICCQPMEISYSATDGTLDKLDVERAEGR